MICKYCQKEFNSLHALNAHIGAKHKAEKQAEHDNMLVKIGDDILDITYKELEILRNAHSGKCDICGKEETANTRPDVKTTPNKLCVDHNHITKKFRGFICVQCNRNMGWYDKYFEYNSMTKK